MSTHVIILAQGSQKRIPTLAVSKTMIALPACADTPIMCRTLRQLQYLLVMYPKTDVSPLIDVVCWPHIAEELVKDGAYVSPTERFYPSVFTHPEPGNSSLKGLTRYLDVHNTTRTGRHTTTYDRTVVLLGDVVYSWACLRAILTPTHWHMGFVGTSDLSTSGGELWGLIWERCCEQVMFQTLYAALDKHPPFTEYQPGQMRRWLWEIDRIIDGDPVVAQTFLKRTWYTPIDDYTMDIDLPEHLALVEHLSKKAAADDKDNGITW